MSIAIPQLISAIPEFVMSGMIFVILLADLFVSHRFRHLVFNLTQLTLVACAVLTLIVFHHETVITFNSSFIVDQIATILKLFIYGLTFLCLLYSQTLIASKDEEQVGAHYILILFSVLGMMVLISAYSFITLFLGLELLSLPLYALIAMNKSSPYSAEAALKYFVLGATASALLLFGMSIIYGLTGQLTLGGIAQATTLLAFGQQSLLILGLIFITGAVAFKLGAVPFHMWIPDVYEGTELSVTLIIATGVKVAAFALLVRLLVEALPAATLQWTHLCMALAILSMSIGNIAAIIQTNIRRMLAYSSMAHMGYLLLGFVSGTEAGFGAAMFYMLVYAIMSLGAFAVLTLMSRAGAEVNTIHDLRGLNTRHPWLAFLMLIIMFSMAGIPPSAGFFAKIAVLMSLVHVHLVWLAALALLFAVMGAYYYLRVVKTMYFDLPDNQTPIVIDGMSKQIAITVNGLFIVVLGVLPVGLFHLCELAFGVR